MQLFITPPHWSLSIEFCIWKHKFSISFWNGFLTDAGGKAWQTPYFQVLVSRQYLSSDQPLVLEPSSGRGGMDREARTRSASRFLILFGFGVTSGYLGQQNSDQQITASIANKGQHDSKGYFRKRESMKQPLKFIQLLRKTGSACTAGTKQPR